MIFRFRDYEFDEESGQLSDGGTPVPLQPLSTRLLSYLLKHRGDVVRRDELIEAVWNSKVVADHSITSRVSALRKTLCDTDRSTPLIRTISKVGFRFIGNVDVLPPTDKSASHGTNKNSTSDTKAPSIAVLPFRLVGVAGPYAHFSDALPDELITELVKQRAFMVIARGSSFRFPSYSIPPSEIAAKLGARYCISGSLEVLGDRLSLSVELADTENEVAIWSDRFATEVEGIFDLRNRLVHRVVAELTARIPKRELYRVRTKDPRSLTAWDHYHMGRAHAFGPRVDRYMEGRSHFEAAISLDPEFARAYAGLAQTYFMEFMVRLAGDNQIAGAALAANSAKAHYYDPEDPFCRLMIARNAAAERRILDAFDLLSSLAEDCPSHYSSHSDLARLYALTLQLDQARLNASRAMQLSPFDPRLFSIYVTMMLIELADNNPEEAEKWAQKSQVLPFRTIGAKVMETITMAANGRSAEAQQLSKVLAEEHPSFEVDHFIAKVPTLAAPFQNMVRDTFKFTLNSKS